jgi:hypothetical protein
LRIDRQRPLAEAHRGPVGLFFHFRGFAKMSVRERHARKVPVGLRPSARVAESGRGPIFEVHQLKFAPGWYVRVLWRYGQEQHVGGFASADEAQSWVHKKSDGWLQNRTAALRSA